MSILLAFAIDAWWDGRGVREGEMQALAGLREELRANAAILELNQKYHVGFAEAATTLLAAAAVGDSSIRPDSVDYLLAKLSGWTFPTYERAVLDVALSAGGLRSLRDTELQRAISDFSIALQRVVDAGSDETYIGLWMAALREKSYLPQIWNKGLAAFPGWQTSEIPAGAPRDNSHLLRDREFVNLLVEMKMVHEDMLFFHSQLREALDALTSALDGRVGL